MTCRFEQAKSSFRHFDKLNASLRSMGFLEPGHFDKLNDLSLRASKKLFERSRNELMSELRKKKKKKKEES
jgi:hypothetical protein